MKLNKAYIGFTGDSKIEEGKEGTKVVSTGRWGGGAFNGNAELKFLIQWIAASLHNRDMIFYTFDHEDGSNLKKIVLIYTGQSVSDVFNDLILFRKYLQKEKKMFVKKSEMGHILFEFLENRYKI